MALSRINITRKYVGTFALNAALVLGLMACNVDNEERSPEARESHAVLSPEGLCEGWPLEAAREPDLMTPYVSGAGWSELRSGEGFLGALRFEEVKEPIPSRAIGRARAWAQATRTLSRSARLAQGLSRHYLDARIDGDMLGGKKPDPALYGLRSLLAAQTGECGEWEQWLSSLPEGPPWASFKAMIHAIRQEGPEGWLPQIGRYSKILSALHCEGCGYSGKGGERHQLLSTWTPGEPPPPVTGKTLYGSLMLAPALESRSESQELYHLKLYDSSLYTTMAALSWKRLQALPSTSITVDFYRLWAAEVAAPDWAKSQACSITQALEAEGSSPFSARVFSPFPSHNAMVRYAQDLCTGKQKRTCPQSISEVQTHFHATSDALRSCLMDVSEVHNQVAGIYQRQALLGGHQRQRLLDFALGPQCDPSHRTESFALWHGAIQPGSPLESHEARMAWLQAASGEEEPLQCPSSSSKARRLTPSAIEMLYSLARHRTLYHPLYELAMSVQSTQSLRPGLEGGAVK